jgi:hypothetical protein
MFLPGLTTKPINPEYQVVTSVFELEHIIRSQLIWYGHAERMGPMRLSKIMINWKPEGRKKRGRPRRTWKDGKVTIMSERGLRMGE